MSKTVIFLDFDGVLHPLPSPVGQLFKCMPFLVEALRQYPGQLELVISSSWRETDSLQELKAHFPLDLQDLVLDTTPIFSDMPQEQIEAMQVASWENIDIEYKRQREIELWLQMHRPNGVPWIAIDDTASDFAPNCPNLLRTNSGKGMQASDVITLHTMIQARQAEL